MDYSTKRIRTGKRTICPDTLMTGKYPGLASTAKDIANYIPECDTFVEPFAGLGRVGKLVKAKEKIFNDMSFYACNYNKRHKGIVTQEQFIISIKRWDSDTTFFFIDPPWRQQIYENNPLPYCDRSPKRYYEELYQILPTLKGDWILCMDKSQKERGKINLPCKYYDKLFESKKTLFNKKISTYCISNKPLINYHQSTLHSIREVTKL